MTDQQLKPPTIGEVHNEPNEPNETEEPAGGNIGDEAKMNNAEAEANDTEHWYIIQAGDSLASIAEAAYGSAEHAEDLFRINNLLGILITPDALSVGTAIRIA